MYINIYVCVIHHFNIKQMLFSLFKNWLFLQKPESLDSRAKYHSLTSGLGNNYTQPRQVGLPAGLSLGPFHMTSDMLRSDWNGLCLLPVWNMEFTKSLVHLVEIRARPIWDF